ncbi:DUF1343 domain-containing protein, partial [candidate division KSB1 bacterium]|nr:DUF1343 domain-containing protein [candidate division KSB1 bacterium]
MKTIRFWITSLLTCGLGLISTSMAQKYLPRGEVLLGIDVLKAQNYQILAGKRVALVTNHTGYDRDGNSTIELLFHASQVQLVKIFSPEHGIKGVVDGVVSDQTEEITKLPIISLYGKTQEPTAEMLADIELLIFDIQDIGTRYYTYISTLAYIMRAARKYDRQVVVLDRPNPISGENVAGTIPPDSLTGKFTAIFPIPTQHGMTIGELARLFNAEFGIDCQLTVVPMQGWQRSMYFDETGLAWINPSPNMKTLTGAILYPGPGCLETTNLSMGRGTETPFEIYGAPWLNGKALAQKMNSYQLPGIRFVPWQFKPSASQFIYYNELCYGVKAVLY